MLISWFWSHAKKVTKLPFSLESDLNQLRLTYIVFDNEAISSLAWVKFSSVLCRISHVSVSTSNLRYYLQHNLRFFIVIKANNKIIGRRLWARQHDWRLLDRWQELCSGWSWRLAAGGWNSGDYRMACS